MQSEARFFTEETEGKLRYSFFLRQSEVNILLFNCQFLIVYI